MSETLWSLDEPPVEFTDRDLIELRRLATTLYARAGHKLTTEQAMNRYALYVGDGLLDIQRFLAGQPTRREQ